MTEFTNLAEFRTLMVEGSSPDERASRDAAARNDQLLKPSGALGRLEEIAIWYCGWRGSSRTRISNAQIAVFAGNHGVAAQGVSAFPAEVTAQMVSGFDAGFAAINQLACTFDAQISAHPIALDQPTGDFTEEAAMNEQELYEALKIGWDAVNEASDIFIAGEMGIGNTTAAAAVCAALWGGTADEWAGRGSGVDDDGLARKAEVIRKGLDRHQNRDPIEVLRCLGGREIAAMAGAIASARAKKIPVILDGFICCAAASVLAQLAPGALDHAIAGHQSAEAAHARLLRLIGKEPLLRLGLRLGEGSGAALALGVVRGAVDCHAGMATFAEAGVSAG